MRPEAIAFCAPCCRVPPTVDTINVCGCDITPQSFVRDIGVFVDNTLCMSTQVARTCQGAYLELHKIAKIRICLTTHACQTTVHACQTTVHACQTIVHACQTTVHACQTTVHALVTSRLWKCSALWNKRAFNSEASNGTKFGGSPNNATAAPRPSAHHVLPHCDHQHITSSLIATISTSRPPSLRPSAHRVLPHCDHQHIASSLIATISTSRPPSLRPSAHHVLPHCDHQHITSSLIATISTSRPPSLRPSARHVLPHCDHQHVTSSLIATISTSRPPSLRVTGCRSDDGSTFFC